MLLPCGLSFGPNVASVLSSDIVAITPTGALVRRLVLAPCPSRPPGGGDTRTPPLVLAPGVAPGHVPYPQRGQRNRAEDCTGTSGVGSIWFVVAPGL